MAADEPTSLYHRLLSSHLQIAGIAGLLLCACLTMIAYFQHGSATIADVRLPASMASARLVNGIEASNNLLRSWVLLGDRASVEGRGRTWETEILPAIRELEVLVDDDESGSIATLRQKLELLRDSQWWVEDIAATVGNAPARLIYERDLLPIYHRIQRAVIGLDGDPTGDRQVDEIRLAVADTHQSLSEAVRQLSEVVRTGSVAEIKDFGDGSQVVEEMLDRLSGRISPSGDARPLLDWILREYRVYEHLAHETISIRQSDDWNRALYILRTDTEPLVRDVKKELNTLQTRHNVLLQNDVSRSALISQVGSVLTFSMIIGLGVVAWAIARIRSNRLAEPIEALTTASNQLARSHDRPVQLPVAGPREIAHLTDRFNYMSRELTTRTKDLQYANRELQEYTHVITHDLKPPLINIKGHAELIRDQVGVLRDAATDETVSEDELRATVLQTVGGDIPESVRFIDLSIVKTNKFIGGVLDNSRLLFRETDIVEIDMKRLLEQVVAVFSHRLDGVDCHFGDLPSIRADIFLIEHIFSNLIDNALKYLDPARPGVIHIAGSADDSRAQFFISDNGIGLGDATINIFKLFRQVDDSSSGNGIGLALVKTMLAKLGGRIWCEPNDPHGTRFIFCIPR